MRPKLIVGGLVALALAGGLAAAQDAPAGLQTGPATIAPHWTKNSSFPTRSPRATAYYVVVRGDTLWDIAGALPQEPLPLAPDLGRRTSTSRTPTGSTRATRSCCPKLARGRRAGRPGARPRRPRGPRARRRGRGHPREASPAQAGGARPRPSGPVTEELSLQCADVRGQPSGRTRASTSSAPSRARTRSPSPSATSST